MSTALIRDTHDAVTMIRALAFDIQGTAVDFHEPLMRVGAELAIRTGLGLDWAALTRDWRGLYREAMDAINAGTRGFETVDVIYRRALDTLLEARGLGDAVPAADRDAINAVWRRLDPWPDSIAGARAPAPALRAGDAVETPAWRRWSRW